MAWQSTRWIGREYRRSVYKNVPTRSISCGTLVNDFAQGRGHELIERPPL